jgi:pyruvate dehydrogenase E2 component (dihydrolipoamide acetyltransferase)
MPIQILMPALSPTMEEGKLAKWLVKEGDKIKSGKVIAEIETDKATMEVEAVDDGTVVKILVPEGTEHVKVNTLIALVAGDGESPAAVTGTTPAQPPAVASTKPSPASASAPAMAAAGPSPAAARPLPVAASSTVAPPPTAMNGGATGRIFASPLARRLAKDSGIELAMIAGSGPHGRIVKRDIEAARAGGRAGASAGTAVATVSRGAPAVAPAPLAPALSDDKLLALYEKGSYDVVPIDNMRRIIAQRLVQAKQTIPHFYLTVDCRLDNLLRARERINSTAPKDGPRAFKLSVNDFVIKAMALALQQVPAANATWTEQGILRHKYSDVGVAVAIDGGLFTPIIRHAEVKSLSEISNEMKDLAERARKRRLAPHEYQGGTTSISNLGMYGVQTFSAVINPPHATILAVGAGEKKAVVAGDRVDVATIMSCTLSCDHRVVDGALGAELLAAFRSLIEDPVKMLV